ncbi:MAG: dihydroneopterin aldolase [Armatimonadetes bacterium JP3_11]|jgi:dihydroneopterin aldolase|nr:MAG: dihydroneopterin aldolase [Armatimonadetes bacterium CP1_7O]OYT75690.1 MAG: dihydroneopterin aldolase [Armatimonadetes bacterium JP3_11]RMH08864.1 MAG: dihydroneopterin aldolase [Armatimonadota bacterium]
MPSDQIIVRGIEFYAYHGVPDAEQQIGHRYWVDVTVDIDLREAGLTDDLRHTVSYGDLARLVIQIGTSQRTRLLETLAEQMCAAILERFPPIQRVELFIAKRLPPTGTITELAGVKIIRTR